jgi:hypothetical protein
MILLGRVPRFVVLPSLFVLVVSGGLRSALAQNTGLIPLIDLGSGPYQGYQGGLYPGGVNYPPIAHESAAMQMAAQIVPRNASGAPDPNGLIVMIAVGMSNTTHEFGAFERNEDADVRRNARVVLMDTAFGGQTAATIANPGAAYWTTMSQRLSSMSLSAAQVQAAWLKEADAQPPDNFPLHAQALRDEMKQIANNLHDRFPNLRLCYVSSRIYGGYAPAGSLNPEPQAYESGFSVKWLIEDQIDGDPALNYGQLPGPIRSPVLLWGPYLWADGTTPRSDGLTWVASDFEGDFTHPGPTAEQKVSNMLAGFFANDATAAPWWPAQGNAGLVARDAVKDAHVSAASPGSNFGSATQLLVQGGTSPINTYLGFDVTGVARPVVLSKLSLRVVNGGGIGPVSLVNDTTWSEGTLRYNNAPPIGPTLITMPQSTKDGTIAANVTGSVNGDADGALSFALTTTLSAQLAYHSKEDAQPPRLVMIAPCATSPDTDGDGRADICDCAPSDAAAFATPREVQALRWATGTRLAWDSEAPAAGSGTRYDVMSGDLDDISFFGTRPNDFCLASGSPDTQLGDSSPPPAPGKGRYFLVRGINACGRGRYETASDGRDRLTTVCP